MASPDYSQGYKCEFIDSVPDDYYCKKCSLVARRLTDTNCCGESYCHACIADTQQQGKPCPECGQQSFTFSELVKFQRRIAALQVYCSLRGRGCDWSGTLEQLDAHLDPDQDNCQHVDTNCPFNCLQTIPKNKVKQHVAEECVKRDYICQFCAFKASYEEVVDTHLPKCIYVPLQCPNLCGVTCERDVIEDHMSICRLEEVACEFSDVGCDRRFRREVQEEHGKMNTLKHLTLTATSTVKMNQQLQGTVQEQEEKLQEQEQKLQEQEQKLQEQEEKLQEQEEKLQEQEQKLQEQEQKLQEQEEKLQDQDQRFKQMYQKQLDVLKSVTQLQKKSEENEVTVTRIKRIVLDSTFTMTSFSEEKAKNRCDDWKSPAMYTHTGGYKFCIGIDANGSGRARGKAVRVEIWSMPGEYDYKLKWPVQVEFTIELINHKGGDNWKVTNTVTWRKPSSNCSHLHTLSYTPSAMYYFIEHSKLSNYLWNDTLYFKVTST